MDAAIQGLLHLGVSQVGVRAGDSQGMPHFRTPQTPTQNMHSDVDADGAQAAFLQICNSYGVSQGAVQSLITSGINSVTVLCMLQPGDLESLGLPLGQLRLLQGVVAAISPQVVQGTSTKSATPQGPATTEPPKTGPTSGDSAAASTVAKAVSGETRRHLGLGKEGEKANYLKVRDYITVLNKSADEEESVELPDGSMFVPKGGTVARKPKMDNISALQYTEAAMRILGKMMLDGTMTSLEQVGQYVGYIAIVARLGQRKDWRSVVRYDDAYREAQSVEAFAWGKDLRDLRDTYLEDKSRKESKPQSQAGGPSKFGGKPKNKGRKGQGGESNSPAGELRICRDFSQGKCSRAVCIFRHMCAQCGSPSHGLGSHPN